MPLPELRAALQRQIRKVEKAREDYERAIEAEGKIHTFLWKTLDSICGENNFLETEITLFYPNLLDSSHENIFIRKLLGLQDQKRTNRSLS